MDENSRLYASPQVGQQGAAYINIDNGRLLPVAILSGAAIGFAALAGFSAYQSERETRMLEYYVMEVDGKLIKAGTIKPEESWSAQKAKRLNPEKEDKK